MKMFILLHAFQGKRSQSIVIFQHIKSVDIYLKEKEQPKDLSSQSNCLSKPRICVLGHLSQQLGIFRFATEFQRILSRGQGPLGEIIATSLLIETYWLN